MAMAKQRIRVIVTDIDNTLFDSEGQRVTIERLVSEDAVALAPLGSRLKQATPSEVAALYRKKYAELGGDSKTHIDSMLKSYGISQPDFDDLKSLLVDKYHQYRDHLLKPFPGVKETIQATRREGVVWGALSNGVSTKQRAKLQLMGIDSFFYCLMVPEDVQKQHQHLIQKSHAAKPNNAIYEAMHKVMAQQVPPLHPREVLYIDDRLDHCAGANSMGWRTVRIVFGKYASQTPETVSAALGIPLELAHPMHEIATFDALRKEVLSHYTMP